MADRNPVAALCSSAVLILFLSMSPTFAVVQHPMDPLEPDEIIAAAQILLGPGGAAAGSVFQSVELAEPSKQFVLAYQTGDPIQRAALVYYRQPNKKSFKSTVDLSNGTFTPPVEIPNSKGQLGLTIQEILDFSFVFENPALLAALAARGLDTPEELANVLVTPLTPGAFGLPEESHRIVKAQLYYIAGAAINLYTRPIEGVQAIIDLDERTVLSVLDSGVVPLPSATYEFDEASIDANYGLRPPLKPIAISQPEGPNFTINGNFIEWQKWRFHLRFDRRVGTVISLVTYDGRSVMYQGTMSEVFVPYQDPDANWFYRTYMDAGEFGFGALSSPLALGLDVPVNTTLLGGTISAALPDPDLPVIPLPLDNVIGIFERVTGNPVWRHFEFLTGQYEGRAEVELVVRMIAQVGNYDYVIDWIFTQHGAIHVEVGLTGIDITKAVASTTLADPTSAADTAYGALVAPNLVAPHHSHHFNFRLDMDVDGRENSFALGELVRTNVSGSPRKSVWTLEEEIVEREKDALLDEDENVWRVINPSVTNANGYPTSYLIESEGNTVPLLKRADYERARFIEHNLWITAHNPNERFAAGDTPNQHPDKPGLPEFIKNNESLVGADLVLWLTVGFHHVTVAEDFPVLPREHKSFELKPSNFFDRNPALDLRRAPLEADL
ncbi:MAG: hypothetical protein ACKVX7_17470 [Planctomycetota bacterium]